MMAVVKPGNLSAVRKAAVDVGSNSVILVVEEKEDGLWRTVIERTWVTSLGSETRDTGLLSEAAMVRTLQALAEAFSIAKDAGTESVVAGATMAARIASNAGDFLARAAGQGTPVFILSGQDEAQLGFEAVAYDSKFANEDRLTIVDVGGQSTELATAERDGGWRMVFRRSFPIGTLALRGGVLKDECPGPEAVLNAVVEVDDTIGLCYRRGQCGSAVALGATGANLVAIREGMAAWDPMRVHGAWLDYGEISRAAGDLMRKTEVERRQIVGMEPGREATLPAGALILERFLDWIGAPGCSVSVRGWRHALLERGLPGER